MNNDRNKLSQNKILKYYKGKTDIIFFDSLQSSNDFAKQNVKNYTKNTVICASEQTGGKGTKGRIFYSPKGGIYLTYVGFNQIAPSELKFITPYAAVAVCKAIKKVCHVKTQIKWVNDVYLNGKKICGILTESNIVSDGKINDFFVGIGINVNTQNFEKEIKNIATSLLEQTGKTYNLAKLLGEIIRQMDKMPKALKTKKFVKSYKKLSMLTGKTVSYNGQNCLVLGINENCNLIIDYSGEKKTLNSGEVTFLQYNN